MVFLSGSSSDLNLNQYESIFRGISESSSKLVIHRELDLHPQKKGISPAQFLGDLDISGVEDDKLG